MNDKRAFIPIISADEEGVGERFEVYMDTKSNMKRKNIAADVALEDEHKSTQMRKKFITWNVCEYMSAMTIFFFDVIQPNTDR